MPNTDELVKQSGWHGMRFHALQDIASTDCVLSVIALRSDGVAFEARTSTFTEAALKQSGMGLLRGLTSELADKLESYRLCACVVGTPCSNHLLEKKR